MKLKKAKKLQTSSETKLDTIIELVKDLPKADYNKLKEGMDLIYKGYQKIRSSRTEDEKENDKITKAEQYLESEKWWKKYF